MPELLPPAIDGATARDTAAEVLQRPEFAGNEPGLLDRIGEALSQLFGQVLDGLTGTAAGTLAGYAVLLLLAVGLGLAIARLLRGLRRDAAAGVATAADVGRGAEAWATDAQAHEAAGRWREAVRCRYRELVAALAARGLVEEVAGRTAGEYVAQVAAAAPEAVPAFREATGIFERAWYGDSTAHPVDAGDLAASRAAAAAVLDRQSSGVAS